MTHPAEKTSPASGTQRGERGPVRGLLPARGAAGLTAVCAAVALAWSLNIAPGDRLFYPATFLVASIYGVGCVVVRLLTGAGFSMTLRRRDVREAFGAGLALAAAFCVGAFLVRFLPFLQDPVSRLLDHARVGSLALVALTTVVNGLAEEFFYRGSLWSVIPRRWRLLLTTLAYTIVTAMVGIPLLAFAAAVLGLVAGVLRTRSRSLGGPVIVHLTWSLTMLVALPHIVH